jgi:hypothetical protein
MFYGFIQDVPIGEPQYRTIMDNIGSEPIDGSLLHLCVREPGGQLRYIDLWESKEACARAFDERIHPAVNAAFGGRRPATEPEVHHLDIVHASGAMLPAQVWA